MTTFAMVIGLLMGCFYLTCVIFIFVVIGGVAAIVGLNIFKIILYVKEEFLLVLGVLPLTSKGAATVTGGGFITLAATLATLHGKVPVAGMVLVLGVDRFMSEARAITNLFGNSVATIFVAWWEGTLDVPRARRILNWEEVPVTLEG